MPESEIDAKTSDARLGFPRVSCTGKVLSVGKAPKEVES